MGVCEGVWGGAFADGLGVRECGRIGNRAAQSIGTGFMVGGVFGEDDRGRSSAGKDA